MVLGYDLAGRGGRRGVRGCNGLHLEPTRRVVVFKLNVKVACGMADEGCWYFVCNF